MHFFFKLNKESLLFSFILILILSLVYWTLYKIIKEYLWSISQKQDGFFLIYYKNNILYKMQSIVLFIWFKVFYKIIGILYIRGIS